MWAKGNTPIVVPRELFGRTGLLSLQTTIPNPIAVTQMVLPSTLLRAMFHEYPLGFRRLLGADTMKLRSLLTSF